MAGKLVTWLGEDDLHYTLMENESGEIERNQAPGPSFMFFNRVRFDKDKPVLLDPDQAPSPDLKLAYEHIIAKAKQNKFFKIQDAGEHDDSEDGEPGGEVEDHGHKVDRKPRLQPVPKRRR